MTLLDQKEFDTAWREFESLRGQALAAEAAKRWLLAMKLWVACYELAETTEIKSITSLEKALILRHIVMLNDKREQHDGHALQQLLDCRALLQKSLELDPEDKATYIRLMALALDDNDIQAYQRLAESAVTYLPKDRDLLEIAIDAANARYDYVRAAGHAKRLFELDGIDFHAKQLFVEACLQQTHRQFGKHEYAQAKKYVDKALTLPLTGSLLLQVQIVEVLLLQQRMESEALPRLLLTTIAHRVENDLLFFFVLLSESVQFGSKATKFSAAFEQCCNMDMKRCGRNELVALFLVAKRYWHSGFIAVRYILAVYSDRIRRAARAVSSADDYIWFCDLLCHVEAYDEALWFAIQASHKFQDHPLFVYYKIYSFVEGDPSRIDSSAYDRLVAVVESLDTDDYRKFLADAVAFLNDVDEVINEDSF